MDPRRIRDYKDLIVWQRATQLFVLCHQIVSDLPRGELGDVRSQIRRAARSVPANIAEGHSRPGRGEFLAFLGTAHASLKELESHLHMVVLIHGHSDRLGQALQYAEECSKMLVSMRRKLNGNEPPPER